MKISHVQRIPRANGAVDLYFRKKGGFRRRLESPDNTPELKAEVDAILQEIVRIEAAAVPIAGTVEGALAQYNTSSEFIRLGDLTKRNYQYMIDELKADCGNVLIVKVNYVWLKQLQDIWARRGHKACNDLMQVLKNALKPAMFSGLLPDNPFSNILKQQPPTNKAEAHPAWDDAEVEAAIELALERKQPGLARAVALGRWGGFRRGSICVVPLNARTVGFDDEGERQRRLYWQTPKRAVMCDKREDSRLTALLDRTPNKAMTIAYNKYGQPWKERSLNQAFDRLIERLDTDKKARGFLDIHGLRHARGIELAHAGASDSEIMAQLEHTTNRAASIYRRQANRSRLADSGQAKVDQTILARTNRSKKSS